MRWKWVAGLDLQGMSFATVAGWRGCWGGGLADMFGVLKAVQALVDDGDPMLIESPVYA